MSSVLQSRRKINTNFCKVKINRDQLYLNTTDHIYFIAADGKNYRFQKNGSGEKKLPQQLFLISVKKIKIAG